MIRWQISDNQLWIGIQITANYEIRHLEKALEAFIKVGRKYNILGNSKQEIIEMYGMKRAGRRKSEVRSPKKLTRRSFGNPAGFCFS